MDLDAYIERIGLRGRPSLAEVHRAHVTSIPFENLDPHGGKAVSLEPADLESKMVRRRRGGYCFEQNLLLAEAYREMGLEVELMLARVLYRVQPGIVRPRTHLVLRVTHAGESWLADAGFGNGTLLEPLPFHPGAEANQAGWSMRLTATDEKLVLQRVEEDEWLDVYEFPAQPVPRVDVEVSNWFVATHPSSPFVTGLMIATHEASGRRLTLSDWGELALVERTPQSTHSTPLARRDIPGLLSERFGLPGFVVGEDGRILAAAGD